MALPVVFLYSSGAQPAAAVVVDPFLSAWQRELYAGMIEWMTGL
jgi:hypothetical protein